MPRIKTSSVFAGGKRPDNYLRQDNYAATNGVQTAAQYINSLASRKLRHHVCMSTGPEDWSGSASNAAAWRIKTSPNMTAIQAVVVLAPIDDTGTTLSHYIEFVCTEDPETPGSATTQPRIYVENRTSAPSTTAPDKLAQVFQTWTNLNADSDYSITLNRTSRARPISVSIYELQNPIAEPAASATSDALVRSSSYVAGAEILNRDIQDLWYTMDLLNRRQASPVFHWSGLDGGFASTTGTTFVNILDSSFTAWDANAPGFWTYQKNKSRVVFGYMKAQVASGTGEITFRVNGSTLWTQTITGGLAWYSTGITMPANDSDKIDILIRHTTGGAIVQLALAGLIEFAT